tara:strand:- start:2463 stop:4058 length:1596 start_codon:yes stop_codon:yes gene_type:complete
VNNRKFVGGKPLASLSLFLAAVLLVPAIANGQRKRSSKTRLSRDEQIEAALRKRTRKIQDQYCRDLVRVANWAALQGLKKDAGAVVDKIKGINPDYPKLQDIREKVEKAEEESDSGKNEKNGKSLLTRLKSADKKQGVELVKLATGCMKVGLFTRSFDMISHVLEISPDDSKARKILGYKKDTKTKEWISTWEYAKRKKYFLSKEGWFEKKKKKDFDSGLRPYKGKWIPAEREKSIRTRNEYAPYSVQSEHFEVLTNMGRARAWEFALKLEDFYTQFFRTFIGYYDQIAGARLLFNRPEVKKMHQVILFPSRNGYLLHVKQEKGNDKLLRESAGFYSGSDRKSRFYWSDNEEETYRTFYHEVAHQLFAETKATRSSGSRGNNWVVEGIAVYIETWKKIEGRWVPGFETGGNRMNIAKRFLGGSKDWSLQAFAHIDNDQFHKVNRGLNYCLAGALCHFFMHYNDEIYKEDFVRFLSAYYMGKIGNDSLAEYIKVEGGGGFNALEKQFKEYMSTLGEKKPEPEVEAGEDALDE